MIGDIRIVMCKEFKELLLVRGTVRGSAVRMLVFVLLLGVFLPYQMGEEWINSQIVLFYSLWFPLMLVVQVIADSFAGERERHTLETLLASRLSDTAILLGKVAASVVYAWSMILGMLVMGLITVNIVHGHGKLLLYPLPTGIGSLVLSLLMSLLGSIVGVLVSLRATTVRQAQQTLGLGAMFTILVPVIGIQIIPADLRMRLFAKLAQINVSEAVLTVMGALVIIDLLLLAVAIYRFQRTRLILD